jgi:serine protease Do
MSIGMRTLSIVLTTTLATAAFAASAHASPAASALLGDQATISDVAENVVDSVVNISTTHQVDLGPASQDPFFNDPDSPFYLSPDQRQQSALGSGVIVSAGGRVLTNAHVIDGADTIKVTLADGTDYGAKLVGVDKRSDLAVLQMQGNLPKLKALPFGDSSKMRLGEIVLAIGDPFGVGQTVTMGIVSAKGRASVGIEDYEDFIQTDAAINPGNSGGALVNTRGELIGINTAILSRSGGYQGVGFAIPTDMAKPIMDALVKDGKVTRGWLGVAMVDLNRDLAAKRKLTATRGVLVANVQKGSPADQAGLQPDDVIIAVDGAAVTDGGHFRNAIAMKGAKAQVLLEVVRGRGTEKLKATLIEAPDPQQQRVQQPRVRRGGRHP